MPVNHISIVLFVYCFVSFSAERGPGAVEELGDESGATGEQAGVRLGRNARDAADQAGQHDARHKPSFRPASATVSLRAGQQLVIRFQLLAATEQRVAHVQHLAATEKRHRL